MRRGIRGAVVAASIAGGAVACGGGGASGGGDWAGSVRDSAGIAVVTNPETGTWTDEERWRITEVLRIGTTGGDPDYQFGQISGIAELSDGRIAVMDMQAQNLRIFGSDGAHVRTVGRAGSGPGEFGPQSGPVLLGPDDSIYIPDATNQRINKFTPDAEPAGSVPLDFSKGIPLAWLDTPEGALISQMRPMSFGQGAAPDSTDVVLSLGPDGAVQDTLLTFRSGRSFSFSDGLPDFEFFSPEPIWATTTDGRIVYGYNDTYRLGLYEDGELQRVLQKPFVARPVAEEDKSILIDAMGRMFEDLGVPAEALQLFEGRINFGDFYPAYALVRGGPEGSIMVQHLRSLDEMPAEERESFNPMLGMGSPVWDVFDPEGRFLGELRLPDRYQPIRIEGDKMFGIWRDELDVQYVIILRVDWLAEELESGVSD